MKNRKTNPRFTVFLVTLSIVLWCVVFYQLFGHRGESQGGGNNASSLYDFKIDYSASFSSPDSYFTGLLNIHDPFFPEQTISVKSPEFTSVVLPTPVFYTGFVTDGTVKRGLFTVLPEENIVAVEGEKVGMYLIRSICPGYSMIEYKDSLFRIAMKPE